MDVEMFKKSDLSWAPRAIIIVSMAFGIGLFDSRSSFAEGCGAYCKARLVRAICHDAVKSKGVKGHQIEVEFEKCKVDPITHKRIQELAEDTKNSLD
jgi:hypothetical protein